MELIILTLVVLGSTILGLFVFNNNPKSITNKIFLILSTSIAIWSLVLYLSLNAQNNELTLFLVRLSTSFAVPLAGSFLLLVHTFPRDRLQMTKKEFYGLVVILAFTMAFTFSPYVFTTIKPSGDTFAPVAGPGMIVFAFVVNGSAILSVILLIQRLIKSKGREKLQLGYLLLGLILMIGLIIITIFLPVAFFQNINFVSFGPLYTLLFLIATAYAMVKHRFLDIRLIVARVVAYIALIFFIGFLYTVSLFLITTFLIDQQLDRTNIIISISLALFIAFSFQPLRRVIEKITDKFFYKDHYDANTLLWDLSRIMASTLDLSEICKKILDKLLAAMRVSYGSIVLIRKSSIIWVGGAGKTSGAPFKGNDIYHLIHESYKPHGGSEQVLIYEELSEGKLKSVMREHAITLVLPLIVRDELIGGILLGEKSSGEIYSSEDIDLLKILSPEVAVAVKNSLSYEEIKRFNITLEEEVKHATERLRHANHKLKELDSLKDEFVSIASHELRTPMTAIKSYLWMALNQPGQTIKEPLKKYLDISYNSTERLIRLVNDMLTVSRIERNKIELKLAPIDVFEIVKAVYDELKVTADERKIHLTLNKSENMKYMVNGDKEKLREVFQNIVGNALKFTPADGTIKIEIGKKGNMVNVSIADTGPGIPKESMPLLFKKFSKIEYSYAKHSNQPGTGLGLYISKQIVSLHNGDIQVQSEVNIGTTFTVLLPSIKNSPEVKKN